MKCSLVLNHRLMKSLLHESSWARHGRYRLFALFLAVGCVAHGDVLEPFDGIAGEPGSGALAFFPAIWDYPIYADRQKGDVPLDAQIAGAALKGGYFFPKLADKFSWGAIFSIPYFDTEDYLELDLVFSYATSERFILSAHATARWETEDLRVDGAREPNTRGHVYSLGPKGSYLLRENVMLSLTWQHDLDAENRLEGDWIYGRVAWGF